MSLENLKLLINNSPVINNISQNTANTVKENENIFEDNKTSYDPHHPEFDDNWEDVEYNKNKALGFLWDTGTYTYTTSNGSTITVKNTDGITIKQNKQTGEIVIIGGNIDDINLSDNNNLTLIEATAKNINAKNGNSTIKIEGAHTSVANITGGKGSQSVIVSAGAKVEHINTGDDDDTVIINNSQVGKIETGKGNDGVIAYNSNITNKVNLGKNDDYLIVTDTSIQGKVITGKGNDTIEGSNAEFNGEINTNSSDKDTNTINLESSKINDDIIAYNGNADIVIKDGSTLAENKNIETGYGNYNVSVDNSNLDGNLVASGFDGQGSYGTFNLNLNNSSLNNVSGLRNDDTTTFNSVNSKSNGAENVESQNNSTKEVSTLNTTEGEFQGYELVNSESVDTRKTYTVKISDTQTKTVSEEEWNQVYSSYYMLLSENVQNVYTLSDGTIVSLNKGGQLYTNKQGDIVINGADKAEITGGNNSNAKITVINSYVVSHNNINGSVEYRNSKIDTISVSDSKNAQISVKDNSRIGDLTSSNSNLTLDISDTSKINSLVSLEEGLLNINSNGGEISKIQSETADINGNIQNSRIGTITTHNGSIDITASGTKDSQTGKITYCYIDKIVNNNKDGETKLNLTYVVSDKISSKSKAEINLDNCTITSKVTASDYQDLINIIDSEVKNLEAKQGEDNLYIQGGSFDKLTASGMTQTTLDGVDIQKLNIHGDIAINKSEIDNISIFGNIVINASEINDLNVSGAISNVDIEDSYIKNSYTLYDDNAHIDYFGDETNYGNLDETQLAIVSSQLEKLSEQELDDVYTLLASLEDSDSEIISELTSQNLTKEEIIKRLNENPSECIIQIKDGLIAEMQGAIKTLEQALEDDKESGGSWLLTSIINSISNDINASNIQAKKEMLSKAIENGDFESLLNAHAILTDEISATKAINEYNDALNYASSISRDEIDKVLTTLGYIGNLMEYNITEQDGIIKNGIAYLNMYFDIGTNRKEAAAYVQTYKDGINNLVEKYENGTLTNEELVLEYKRLTGNSFTKDNIETILNNDRNDDVFENNAQEKIEDYQKTQQTIMQVGEYTITIAAGTAVTLVSGGAAGPAIASALSTVGKMGIALTATTVSFLTKTAIEATERQTNGIAADDMTAEEIGTQAALMYAGCFCGQFGNAVGDYIRVNAPEFLSQFISSKEMVNIATKVLGKTLEITSDTSASVLTTAMITGSGEWNEEFMQNLRSEMIGLIQSKITGAYFKAHPDLQINTQLYSMRKGLSGLAEAEANIQVLKQFGFSDSDAGKLSTLTSDEVDTIILLKATNDLCDASLKSHGIDISRLSAEEKIEQGKIVDDLYANADKITQQTDSTCSVVSVLNAINNKPILLQALANKFEYNVESDTYKFNMFGEDFEVQLKEGDNLLQKVYEAYQIQYGDTKTSAIDVFNAMLDGACDILVRPCGDIAQTLKGYTEDDSSILTFNTTEQINGISSGHSYTVLSVDDMGNMRLQDPNTLEEITLMRSDYENKDCQIQGKTYKDSGIVDDEIELKLAAGVETKSDSQRIMQEFSLTPEQREEMLNDEILGRWIGKQRHEDFSDRELVVATELYKRGYQTAYYLNAKELANMADDTELAKIYKTIEENSGIDFYEPEDMIKIANFDEVQTAKMQEIIAHNQTDDKFSSSDIMTFLELDNNSYQNALKILDMGAAPSVAAELCPNMNEERYARLEILLKYDEKIGNGHYGNYLDIEPDKFERLIELLEDPEIKYSYDIEPILKLDDDVYLRYKELKDLQVSRRYMSDYYDLPDDKYKEALGFLRQGIEADSVKYIINTEGEIHDELIELASTFKKGNSSNDIDYLAYSIAKLTPEQFAIYKDAKAQGDSLWEAVQAAKLDESQGQYTLYREMRSLGAQVYEALDLIQKYGEAQQQIFIQKLKEGYTPYNAKRLATLNDEQYKQYEDTLEITQDFKVAIEASGLNPDEYNVFKDLYADERTRKFALECAKYSPEQLEKYRKLCIEENVDPNCAKEIAKYMDYQYETYRNLVDNYGLGCIDAMNLSGIILENQLEAAVKLVKRGYSSSYLLLQNISRYPDIASNLEQLDKLLLMGADESEAVKAIVYHKDAELMQQLQENQNELVRLINSNDGNLKIKESLQGPGQDKLYKIFDIESVSYTTLYMLKESGLSEDEFLTRLSFFSNSDYIGTIDTTKVCMDDVLALMLKIPESELEHIDELSQKVETLRAQAIERPELYVNGEFENKDDAIEEVNKFFNETKPDLILLATSLDKEAMNNLLRMRFEDALEYIELFQHFTKQDIKLLKDMASSHNIDGKPIMPTQKIEFIDIITAYKENNLDMSKMFDMIESDRIDTAQLNVDLFNGLLRNCGLTDEEISQIPIEKLTGWDIKYAHMLSKEINDNRNDDNQAFIDLLRAGNLDEFARYIQDESNIYGQTNAKTKAIFEQKGLDYDAWLKPSKDTEVNFIAKDKNIEQLEQISTQITEDIESLRQTPAKGFVDKQFGKYIKDGHFVIPNEYTTSKAKLEEFTNNILKQLEPVFKRAEGNINNPQKAATAQNTLTIKDHLNQRLSDIANANASAAKSTKTFDLTIKMWDRVPQKDIFQGNYSTCCIGMGGGNGNAMPHYLLNTAYNMIELVDNATGQTLGNALVYFITDSDGKPAFIIDNIEIRNSNKPSDNVGIELRDAIVQYAHNVACEVTGSDDTKIYMSSQYNDVPYEDLEVRESKISFLGDTDCEEIYMDLYGGWVSKEGYTSSRNLLELKN